MSKHNTSINAPNNLIACSRIQGTAVENFMITMHSFFAKLFGSLDICLKYHAEKSAKN